MSNAPILVTLVRVPTVPSNPWDWSLIAEDGTFAFIWQVATGLLKDKEARFRQRKLIIQFNVPLFCDEVIKYEPNTLNRFSTFREVGTLLLGIVRIRDYQADIYYRQASSTVIDLRDCRVIQEILKSLEPVKAAKPVPTISSPVRRQPRVRPNAPAAGVPLGVQVCEAAIGMVLSESENSVLQSSNESSEGMSSSSGQSKLRRRTFKALPKITESQILRILEQTNTNLIRESNVPALPEDTNPLFQPNDQAVVRDFTSPTPVDLFPQPPDVTASMLLSGIEPCEGQRELGRQMSQRSPVRNIAERINSAPPVRRHVDDTHMSLEPIGEEEISASRPRKRPRMLNFENDNKRISVQENIAASKTTLDELKERCEKKKVRLPIQPDGTAVLFGSGRNIVSTQLHNFCRSKMEILPMEISLLEVEIARDAPSEMRSIGPDLIAPLELNQQTFGLDVPSLELPTGISNELQITGEDGSVIPPSTLEISHMPSILEAPEELVALNVNAVEQLRTFDSLLVEPITKLQAARLFTRLLSMQKKKVLELVQLEPFGTIYIRTLS